MSLKIGDVVNYTAIDDNFDRYPQLDKRYGPYENVDTALTTLKSSDRCVGLTIGIKTNNTITEYWFTGGTDDANLVEKCDAVYSKYQADGGTKTKDEFYNTLTQIVDTATYVVLHSNVDDVKVEVTVSKTGTTIGASDVSK